MSLQLAKGSQGMLPHIRLHQRHPRSPDGPDLLYTPPWCLCWCVKSILDAAIGFGQVLRDLQGCQPTPSCEIGLAVSCMQQTAHTGSFPSPRRAEPVHVCCEVCLLVWHLRSSLAMALWWKLTGLLLLPASTYMASGSLCRRRLHLSPWAT